MLLTIRTTSRPATDLGYLLRKNPARAQTFDLSFGKAHVFYPEATEEACTAALMLEVDPVGLVRNRRGPAGEGALLEQYVNDRPYAASSFLSVAIAQVLRSALGGVSLERPALAKARIPLEARLAVVPSRGGEELLRRLFAPLGYEVTATPHALDPAHPEWGPSAYFTLELRAECRLAELLSHLYVLVPVLDDDKHYWVGEDEVEKLLRFGEGWLSAHPERELIARRYLRHRGSLVRGAIERLVAAEGPIDTDQPAEGVPADVAGPRATLHEQRLDAVVGELEPSGAKSVLDLGCGEGKLLRRLLERRSFERIVGMDVSHAALEIAAKRLKLDRLGDAARERLSLIHGSLLYRDARLEGFDAAAVVEVIEHLEPQRLRAFEQTLFEFARPRTVVLTTPNAEYNVKWESLSAGTYRHHDHRFEWTRDQLAAWAGPVARRRGYMVRYEGVGEADPAVGAPTQMAVFDRV